MGQAGPTSPRDPFPLQAVGNGACGQHRGLKNEPAETKAATLGACTYAPNQPRAAWRVARPRPAGPDRGQTSPLKQPESHLGEECRSDLFLTLLGTRETTVIWRPAYHRSLLRRPAARTRPDLRDFPRRILKDQLGCQAAILPSFVSTRELSLPDTISLVQNHKDFSEPGHS